MSNLFERLDRLQRAGAPDPSGPAERQGRAEGAETGEMPEPASPEISDDDSSRPRVAAAPDDGLSATLRAERERLHAERDALETQRAELETEIEALEARVSHVAALLGREPSAGPPVELRSIGSPPPDAAAAA